MDSNDISTLTLSSSIGLLSDKKDYTNGVAWEAIFGKVKRTYPYLCGLMFSIPNLYSNSSHMFSFYIMIQAE
jgi:hypothetical protein